MVLGAYQVGANGDLANWPVPGMTGGGLGGAMDLAVVTDLALLIEVTGEIGIMQECWGD